jgi:hypothetical protein
LDGKSGGLPNRLICAHTHTETQTPSLPPPPLQIVWVKFVKDLDKIF